MTGQKSSLNVPDALVTGRTALPLENGFGPGHFTISRLIYLFDLVYCACLLGLPELAEMAMVKINARCGGAHEFIAERIHVLSSPLRGKLHNIAK